jgi:hypothetical protein
MLDGKRRIGVAMPTADLYKRTVSRDEIVQRYGESTVVRAELAAVMNIMIAMRMVSSQELVDVIIRQCEMIDQRRRADANLDSDRG